MNKKMNRKLNKFKLKRLFLLVIALAGIVVQAKATYYAKMTVHVGKGSGTVYVGESGQTSQTLSTGTQGGNITFTLGANASTGYSFAGWYSDSNCTNSAGGTVKASSTNNGTAEYDRYAKFDPVVYWGDADHPDTYVSTNGITYNQGGTFTIILQGNVELTTTLRVSEGTTLNILPKDPGRTYTIRISDSDVYISVSATTKTSGNQSKLVINGNHDSKNSRIIIDGGAKYTTLGDARTEYVSGKRNMPLIYCSGALDLENVDLINCYHRKSFDNSSASSGGAIDCTDYSGANFDGDHIIRSVNFKNVKISGCFSNAGSAIIFYNTGYHIIFNMEDCHIFHNKALAITYGEENNYTNGGTIRTSGATSCTATIAGCHIYENESVDVDGAPIKRSGGGGIFWNAAGTKGKENGYSYDSKLILTSTESGATNEIYNNYTNNNGGGIYAATSMELESANIHDNEAVMCGGGIYMPTYSYNSETRHVYPWNVRVSDNVMIHENKAGENGGGCYLSIGPSKNIIASNDGIAKFYFSLNGGQIYGNTAKNAGGVYINDNAAKMNQTYSSPNPIEYQRYVEINSGSIYGNHATGDGGAICINRYLKGGIDYTSGGGNLYVNIYGGEIKENIAGVNSTKDECDGGAICIQNDMMQGDVLIGNVYVNLEEKNSQTISIHDNEAKTHGGSIYVKNGDVTYTSGIMKKNKAEGGNGGGFYVNSGDVKIKGGEIIENEANAGNGGGVYQGGGSLTFTGGSIGASGSANKATNGAGLYLSDGNLKIEGGTISGNIAASNGGGAYLGGGTLTVKGSTISGNQAANGAGLYANGGSVTVSGSSTQISNNIASTDGGGVYAKSALTINGSTLQNNQADNGNGGAFYVEVTEGAVDVSSATIDDNKAVNGAGAYVAGNLNLTRSSITNNIASGNGGGVYSNGGTTTLTEMTVSGNRAGTGGGFYVGNEGSIGMNGGSITYNTATKEDGGNGGGIYTEGDFTFESGDIDHNAATFGNGGGVYAAGGTFSISTGNVTYNTATNGDGGGIYAKSGMTMSGGSIANNTAENGGGLYAQKGTSTLTDGDIQANAAYNGGGIYIDRNATLNLYKSVNVTRNTCGDVTSGLGGGIYQDGTLNVAGTDVKVSGNVKENPSKGVQTPNNVYLVGEYGSGNGTDDHFTCINIVNWTDTVAHITYHGLQENVDIGINVDAVPHAVIHSEAPNDPGHLKDLYTKLRDHADDALLKDDLGKYQAIYADAPLPYNLNDIFFTGTWQAFAYPEDVTEFKDTDRAEDHDEYFGNISTEQRLAEFMCYVNGLNGYTRHPNQNGKVTRDLYMSAYIWLPIGSEDGNNPYPDGKPLPYSGHFDGGGHIINGLTSIGLLDMTSYGLFGHTAEATISNTFVTECLYRSNVAADIDTYDTIGGIVGKMVGGKLYYSESGGTLFSNSNHSIMGGLVGYAEGAEIHSCMAMPAMECGEGGIMGGLVGKMYAKDRDLNYGFCRVMNCFANPMFTTTATTAIGGGLVGVMDTYSPTYNRCEVTESYVRLDRKHSFPETFATDKGIAALVGDMSKTNNTTSMNNVYLPEEGHCGVPGYSYVYPHRITPKGSISNYATYRAVSDPGVYAYDPAQDTKIDVIQQGVIPCPDEPQLLPQLLKQAVDRNYAEAEEDRPVPPICYWKRTGASSFLASGENINGDYPILDFDSVSPICGKTYAPAYIALGSKDGLTMDYCVSLSDMIRRYNDYEGGGAINLFHNADVSGPDDFKATDNDVRLYIDEGITVLQGEGGFLNAVSYQTLRYGHVDYWHTFSSVMGPRTTSIGTKGESRIGFNYGITGEVAYDYDNGNPCNVTLDHGSDTDPNSNHSLFPYDTKLDSLDLYSFYEPQYHWINFKRNSNSHWHMDGPWEKIEYENEKYLIPGKGYLVALHPQPVLDSDGNPVFDDQGYQVYNAKKIYEYGILNCGNVTSGTRKEDLVTYTIQASGRGYPGYNLLGNPYQAYLDLDAFAEANMGLWSGERDLDTTFYMYDAEQNAYLGYKYGTEPSEGSIMPSKWIAPHQGFFVVKSNSEPDAPTTARFIETGEGGMAHLTGDGGLLRGENDKPACRLVNLVMKDEAGHADVASIEFGRQKQGGLPKQQALRSGEAIIYTSYQDKDYAMLLLEEDVKSLPLHFECTEGGTYTLSWNTANGQFVRLVLVDNLTGVSTDCLSHDSYTFEASPDDFNSRFKLVFHYDFDEEEESESHISNFAFINGGDLIVNGQGIMEIIDMNGHVIVRTRLTDNQSRVSIPEVAAGVYVIRLNEKSQKIVIWK